MLEEEEKIIQQLQEIQQEKLQEQIQKLRNMVVQIQEQLMVLQTYILKTMQKQAETINIKQCQE